MLKEISYLAVTNENSAKSPIQAVAVSALSPTKSPIRNITSPNNEQENKENSDFQIHNMRSKLHRLGKLYSGKQHFKIRLY